MTDQSPSIDGLRALVREALGDLLPELAKTLPDGRPSPSDRGGFPPRTGEAADSSGEVETVMLRSDADLAAFVSRLLHLFENPKHREDLRTGRLRFRFAPVAAPGSFRPVHRIEKGAVTEATVREAARSGAKIVLGPNAVLTPLGRDRARAEGVEVEKEH
jgi:hypothetical protein